MYSDHANQGAKALAHGSQGYDLDVCPVVIGLGAWKSDRGGGGSSF